MKFAMVLTGLMTSSAYAQDASEVLAQVDRAMSASEDLFIKYNVMNQLPGSSKPRSMVFTTKVQGNQSLTEFLGPGDLKGTRVLVVDRSNMWIYLPAYNKVRKLANHNTRQGFMDTTYSHDDMSSAPLGDVYAAVTLLGDTETAWQLELGPKAEQQAPYPKVHLTVDKKTKQPIELKYFNEKGLNVKTETRSDFACEGEVCIPGILRMEDHLRQGAWTEMTRAEYAINPGFDDATFTVKYLQRGY